MAEVEDIKPGIYRHFKGTLYQVLGLAHDANASQLGVKVVMEGHGSRAHAEVQPLGERTVVVYIPLQLDEQHLGPRMAVRSIDEWDDLICADKSHEHYGLVMTNGSCLVERFTYLGPVLTEWMLQERDRGLQGRLDKINDHLADLILVMDPPPEWDRSEILVRVTRVYDRIRSVITR